MLLTEQEEQKLRALAGRVEKLEKKVAGINDHNPLALNALKFKASDGVKVDVIRDEDDMASDDENALSTQQSIKAWGDNAFIKHSLADAANDFLVASGDDAFVKKTLAETGAILEGDIDHGNLQGLDTGADHSYIDQDVTSGSKPNFDGENFTGIPDGALDSTFLKNLVEDTSPELGANLNANDKAVNNIKVASFNHGIDKGNLGATPTFYLGNANIQTGTLTANCTATLTYTTGYDANFTIRVTQDGTGGRTLTFTDSEGGDVYFPGGTVPIASGAGDVSVINFYYDGTDYYGTVVPDFVAL